MAEQRYLIITAEDAAVIARALTGSAGADERRVAARLSADTGADMEEIVDLLKRQEICAACSIEGQAAPCCSHGARKLGRRLARLLERARGERAPGPGPEVGR